MTAQQLKNSILQMAVQGKLVPQDPNDEPASVLLERIRAEKERLIKEKKIKREKNPSVIFKGADNTPYEKIGDEVRSLADEVPFDIPNSWEWVRLGTLLEIISDGTHKTPNYVENGIPFLSVQNISKGYFDFTKIKYITEEEHRKLCERVAPQAGDILFCRIGTLGKAIKCTLNIEFSIFVSLGLLRPIDPSVTDYLVFTINSPLGERWIQENKVGGGTHTYKINLSDIPNMLIPLPPHQEQNRIFAKLQELKPILHEYGKTEERLDSLSEGFPEALKRSILQEAARGKLVPQDPSDEPAEALLERIRAEKQRLIKEGKIKKDKHESVIFRRDNSHYEKRGSEEVCIDEEIQFEVPSSWALIRLDDIGIYRKGPFGSSLTKSMFVPKGADTVKVYEQKNAIQKDHTLGTYYITRQYYESKMRSFTVQPGDILVSCAGTIGETYVLPEQIELGIINQALMRMTIFAPIDLDYFLLYFDYVLKQTAKESSKGSAIKNIPPFEIFKKLILPLPPLEEQKRIVEKVHELESLCNSLCS